MDNEKDKSSLNRELILIFRSYSILNLIQVAEMKQEK